MEEEEDKRIKEKRREEKRKEEVGQKDTPHLQM
jgi:hypothetical protein